MPLTPSKLPPPVRGALAGTLATVPMSAVMLGARALGFTGRQPPEAIVRQVGDLAGVEPTGRTASGFASLAHLGFGASVGALFPAVPRVGPPAVRGAAVALGVYAASYEGWVPALGALPPAHRDNSDRQAVLVVGHLVYGAVLGLLEDRLR